MHVRLQLQSFAAAPQGSAYFHSCNLLAAAMAASEQPELDIGDHELQARLQAALGEGGSSQLQPKEEEASRTMQLLVWLLVAMIYYI